MIGLQYILSLKAVSKSVCMLGHVYQGYPSCIVMGVF